MHSTRRGFAHSSLVALLAGGALVADTPFRSPAHGARVRPAGERVATNDNRTPAGTLRDGVLTVRLEAREGEWHPDRDTDPGVLLRAFGEQGKPLQIPGPLIRVAEGTTIHAIVKNALAGVTLTVHGLHTRSADGAAAPNAMEIPPGAEREVRFVAGAPGTYFYRATTSDARPQPANGPSAPLNGALVVDPRSHVGPPRDRVFVVGAWADSISTAAGRVQVGRIVINGKAWPHTERLTAFTGDTVRWRVINVTGPVHPMHLHGFYFNVTSRGDGRVDSLYAPTARHLVNTERMAAGRTISLSWVPDRPGNWLFHCHDNVHIQRGLPLDGSGSRGEQPHHVENHALEMMGGPVMGVHVQPRGTVAAPIDAGPRRRLRLVARSDSGGNDGEPAFGFALDDGKPTSSRIPLLPGPTLVLRRGQPVSIMVVNELAEPTAVHWHGIELDSYYDGVAGFAGSPGRIAPPIAARDSFEARFTPPRAGTFIYHSHIDEVRQQQAGLAGALIVLDPGAVYDPETDIPLLVTVPRFRADFGVVLLNGTSAPAPREWRVGTRYRLRFINIHTFRPSMRMAIEGPNGLLTWRPVAKDGMDLPPGERTPRPSSQQMGNGETYDFELTPTEPGDLRLTVSTGGGALLVAQPIRIR